MACDEGQEEHLQQLAQHLDARMGELAENVGHIGDMRLLVMASLLVADELFEAYKEIHLLKSGAGDAASGQVELFADEAAGQDLQEALLRCVERAEKLAGSLATGAAH
jgi:cell division protein ZapA